MDGISGAASIAGLISLADLIVKYSKLIGVWKNAPDSVRRIQALLVSLQPIIARLEELQALSEDALFQQGLNIAAFTADMNELRDLADDMLGGEDRVRTWKRTKWTLRTEAQAIDLAERLKSHIAVFGIVMDLASQKSAADMKLYILGLLKTQSILHVNVLELLDINRDTQRRLQLGRDHLQLPFATKPQPPTYEFQSRSSNLILRTPNCKTSFEVVGGKSVYRKGHVPSCPFVNNLQINDDRNCDCFWGIGQSRFRNTKTRTPHTGRQKESIYLFETEFTTWQTMFGKFRLHLLVEAKKQAWSLSFPTITLSKQNIVPEDASVFALAEEGDIEGILELFRKGLASPNDRTIDGWTPLMWAIGLQKSRMAEILIDEGADVLADLTLHPGELGLSEKHLCASEFTVTPISLSVWMGQLDTVFSRLVERGADLFTDPALPELLYGLALHNRAGVHILANIADTLSDPHNSPSNARLRQCNPYYQSLRHGSLDGFQNLQSMGYPINTLFKAKKCERLLKTPLSVGAGDTWWNKSSNVRQEEYPDLALRDLRTGWMVLHPILSGDWCDTKNSDFSRFHELIVFLINSGADPKASENGVTPTELVWKGANRSCATVQRRVILWYLALRSCGLNPQDYDSDYDSRFDRMSEGCHFCLRISETNDTSEFVACPWCFGDLYGLRSDAGEWYTKHDLSERYPPARHHVGSTSSGTRAGRSMYPCCSAVCSRHIGKVTRGGLLLPVNSGAQMRRYRELRKDKWYERWYYSLEWIEGGPMRAERVKEQVGAKMAMMVKKAFMTHWS
ncbi:hypothetical protein BDD12DRAFT_881451 [Trichophaea hybrida]|nr:hypothetical protein BDD12DRAFT_881451 [Trichophaea hybrida]